MAKQVQVEKTTVELNIKQQNRQTMKVKYPNGDVLKIAYGPNGHKIESNTRQISDASMVKVLKFVSAYKTNTESNAARFKRNAEFFEGTQTLAQAVELI